jgi:hypothetical protein
MFNHIVTNYYIVTFILKEASLKMGANPVPETGVLNFNTCNGRSLYSH